VSDITPYDTGAPRIEVRIYRDDLTYGDAPGDVPGPEIVELAEEDYPFASASPSARGVE
jgi:hypothetical protein